MQFLRPSHLPDLARPGVPPLICTCLAAINDELRSSLMSCEIGRAARPSGLARSVAPLPRATSGQSTFNKLWNAPRQTTKNAFSGGFLIRAPPPRPQFSAPPSVFFSFFHARGPGGLLSLCRCSALASDRPATGSKTRNPKETKNPKNPASRIK